MISLPEFMFHFPPVHSIDVWQRQHEARIGKRWYEDDHSAMRSTLEIDAVPSLSRKAPGRYELITIRVQRKDTGRTAGGFDHAHRF